VRRTDEYNRIAPQGIVKQGAKRSSRIESSKPAKTPAPAQLTLDTPPRERWRC